MKFYDAQIEPSYSRRPDFVGYDFRGAEFAFECDRCSRKLSVPYKEILDASWNRKGGMGNDLVEAAKARFGLNMVGRSHYGGFPSLIVVRCDDCDARHLIYAGAGETSNSVYQVTVQGIIRFEV